MNNLEILELGPENFEVWDYWGNRLFEAETRQECEDWISENEEE